MIGRPGFKVGCADFKTARSGFKIGMQYFKTGSLVA